MTLIPDQAGVLARAPRLEGLKGGNVNVYLYDAPASGIVTGSGSAGLYISTAIL